jgi:uncharacterized protein (DUF1810 family)
MSRLDRFRTAQASPHDGFETALEEIAAGRKQSHWIWYVFPQISGLGRSGAARLFGIEDENEALEYLRDRELRGRLLTIAQAVADQLARGVPLRVLMGSEIDALKVVSSLTLFGDVAARLSQRETHDGLDALASTARQVLAAAEAQGYPACAYTRGRLQSTPRPSS